MNGRKEVNRAVTEAQIYLTRQCNINCGYCNLTNNISCRHVGKELELSDWKTAFINMEQIGIRTIKILGGEPTAKDWLPELIRWAGEKTRLKVALLSNSGFSENMLGRLVDAGLYAYYASVDGLSAVKSVDIDAEMKSRNGYAMLLRMKRLGVPLLGANVVVSKANLTQIPELVMLLSDDGIYVNLCTVQHTKDSRKCFSKTWIGSNRLTQEDVPALCEVLDKLLEMKRDGVKISVPESYISGMERYGVECNWQCSDIVQMRVDADGGLMLCNEYRTRLAEEYNVMALSPKTYAAYLNDWRKTRDAVRCDGCYWSCFVQAEENIQKGILEFDFA